MPKKASSETVNTVLDALAEGMSISSIIKSGVSTPVLYKVIEQFPLWSYKLLKP